MTDESRPHRYLSNEYVRSNALPLTLISQHEMVRRIEEARLEYAPPTCHACGSRTTTKWCPGCERELPVGEFDRRSSVGRLLGRRSTCIDCGREESRVRMAALRKRRALEAVRRAS